MIIIFLNLENKSFKIKKESLFKVLLKKHLPFTILQRCVKDIQKNLSESKDFFNEQKNTKTDYALKN